MSLCLLLHVPPPSSAAALFECNRRAFGICGGATAFTIAFGFCPVAAAADADEPRAPVTRMDLFQLRATYNGLDDALQAWRVEIAQVQLGNEPSSVVAVAGMNDNQLQHFSESGSGESVESFKKRRDAMLQFLFLARGAARYEKDASVAEGYVEKAKAEAEGAQGALRAIASAAGVDLSRTPRKPPATGAAPAPEDKVIFTPRSAPVVENRLVF